MAVNGNNDEDARRAAVRQALGAVAGMLRVGVLAVDADGRCWFGSQRWLDRSGTAGPSFAGRPWYDGVHPDDRQEVAARWQSLLGHRGRLGTFRTVGIDGSVWHCRAESVPMVGVDGQQTGYLVLVTDAGDSSAAGDGHGDGDEGDAAGGLRWLSTPEVLDVVLAGSPDIITIFNADGSWRWSSGAALRLLGHQAEFNPQDGIFGLMHPDDVPRARRILDRAVRGDLAVVELLELRLRAADGSWRDMECLIDPLLDEPSVHGVVVHARDVTERRSVLDALEATNRRLADVISSMKAAVLVEDEHGQIVLVNQALVDLFRLNMAPEDLVGCKFEDTGVSIDRLVVDPPDAARHIDEMRRRGRRIETARVVLVDGRTIEYDFVPTRARGTDLGNLWTMRDISHQARAEAERERLLASERDENRRLAELDAFRSESIAAVSHELRTPLTSIVGYTQLLRNMIDPGDRSDEAECIAAISRNVDRLLRLAGDVVSLDSLESRTLPLVVEPVDIGRALRQSVTSVTPQATARGIRLGVDVTGDRPLHGDADRLVQLFENLLSNAVKFTPEGGKVTVSARPEGEGWRVAVADTGIGIPEDEIELLFARFFRASNARTRGIGGSGLGLSVARAIVDRHRGTIAVESMVGVGTTLSVLLRDAPEHAASGNPGDALSDDARRIPTYE